MLKIEKVLQDNPALKQVLSGKGNVVVNDINDEALLINSAFLMHHKNILVVKNNQYEANQLYQRLVMINENASLVFPVDESYRVESLASSPELLEQRLYTLDALNNGKPKIIVTHVQAMVRYLPTKQLFNDNCLDIKVGNTIDIYDLQRKLVEAGYQYSTRVDQPFYFSKRGGVIDVYSIQYEYPIRIEFFDDEVDSIRYYNPETQRTIESIKEIRIIPASDILYRQDEVSNIKTKIKDLSEIQSKEIDELYQDDLDEKVAIDIENFNNHDTSFAMYSYFGLFKETCTLLDYIDNPTIIVDDQSDMMNSYRNFVEENYYYYQELVSIGKSIKGLNIFKDYREVMTKDYVEFKTFGTSSKDIVFNARNIIFDNSNENKLVSSIRDYLKISNVVLALQSQKQINMMIELLDRHGLFYSLLGVKDGVQSGLNIVLNDIGFSVELIDEKLVIISANDIFKNTTVKKPKYFKYKNAKVLNDYQELSVGDYVVHDNYGIGQFLGIKTLEVQGYHKDYLYVSYSGDDTLYIPVEQFKLIRKYSSSDGRVPKVNKLGGSQWQKTKAKARNKVDDIAERLIDIYATRMQQTGFAFAPDDELQLEFEKTFGYELTVDQQRSVDEIKEDMEKLQPMDRLLCGDVGFGKTEVALRAAYKAILSNKQVAFLCPTTILSMQHYKTMVDRFKDVPVRIALLNRFTSTKQKNQILADLKAGQIDLLVGTHRILSNDIVFKDLGLLCIDEEQRFGVKQKERIKEYRKTIDVLTLTATPIPRTLQMSLMGIRGLSQINTPPKNRQPVQTYVVEKNNLLIKQIIERELARDGQVFYLYNRTSEISNVAYNIEKNVEGAKVAIGHGQMDKHELEDVMMRFVNKEFNVLVCTTIIETGIDIPNANTIIVEDADRFGLSQLYQIKGRVGRSDRGAYAYLLYNREKSLNEDAVKRLKAIKEFTELGSGYKIAMRDLSIRGAGDILGGSQSGFIDSIGFEMYMKILQDAINEKMGKEVEETKEIKNININVDGYIPQDYVSSDIEKLELYQRLENVQDLSKVDDLKDEFVDYYGKLPDVVSSLIDKRKLDILASEDIIDDIVEENKQIQVRFSKEFSNVVKGDVLFELVNRLFTKPRLKQLNGKITVVIDKNGKWLERVNELISTMSKTK